MNAPMSNTSDSDRLSQTSTGSAHRLSKLIESKRSTSDIEELQADIANWADAVNPDRDAMSTIAKLLEEIGELIASERMSDPMELADVAILVLDLFHLQRVDMHQAVTRKMTKNRARRWKRQDNGALSHVQ
jgi:NTP pyrophosphatase (non-canonical NTP hydrolase)